MFKTTRAKVISLLAAVFLTITLGGALLAPAAHAASGNFWCIETADWCLNAWNGGPFVKVYNSNGGTNNYFTDINSATLGYANMEDTGDGNYAGYCIGDYNNNANDARAGLVGGCGASNIGWGGNMGTQFCANNTGVEFWDAHWNGWLGPENSNGNGTQFYLNKPNPYCFIFS